MRMEAEILQAKLIDCIGFAVRSSHQSKIVVHTAWSSKLRKSLIYKPDLTLCFRSGDAEIVMRGLTW